MSPTWSIVDVSSWTIAGEETQGRQPHPWLSHPSRSRTWLWKPLRPKRDGSLGEHITEKLSSELASAMGVPCAVVDLARRDEVQGCIVEDVRWSGGELYAGRVLLPNVLPDADSIDLARRGHNLDNIQRALEGLASPPGAQTPPEFAAFDVFVGYLALDALIANGDRHDRNWAVLRPPPGEIRPDALCASFDHASSLGFSLSDDERRRHLAEGTVAKWTQRGVARQFEYRRGEGKQTLVDLAGSAAARCSPAVRHYWQAAVMSVRPETVDALVSAAPEISSVTTDFTREIIAINRERLVHVLS